MSSPEPGSRGSSEPSQEPEAVHSGSESAADGDGGSSPEGGADGGSGADTGRETGASATYPQEYVSELRRENASWRTRAQRADELARRLTTEIARNSQRMADARDLPYSEELLDENGYPDPEKVNNAIDELIRERPHLGDRRPRGSVDQGPRDSGDVTSLADVLRARAG